MSTVKLSTRRTNFCATELKPIWVEAECHLLSLSLVTESDSPLTIFEGRMLSTLWAGLLWFNTFGRFMPTEGLLGDQ